MANVAPSPKASVGCRNRGTAQPACTLPTPTGKRHHPNIHADNPFWGPERIYDQLVDLGFDPPSPNTIRKYLPKPSKDSGASSQTWKTFIANHMDATWSMDLFVVPTITFRTLYVFVVLSHERRQIVQIGVTQHPTMLWLVQQLREATGFGTQPRYVIRDNDKVYGGGVPAFLKSCGVEEVRTAFRSPWQNPYVGRVVGTLRHELLDHIIPLNEKHLQRLLAEYIGRYYDPVRTHSNLDHKPPSADLLIKKPHGRSGVQRREGRQVTILGKLVTVYRALEAAEILAKDGIDAEVIDPRTLVPFDWEALENSIRKAGRLVIVDECPASGGWTADIAAKVMDRVFDYLDAPVVRVTAPDTPVPFAPEMEEFYLPDAQKIVEAVRQIV